MDPISIGVAMFIGGLFFKTQQDMSIEEEKKSASKPQQQTSSQQQRKPPQTNKAITKCPHCGGSLDNEKD
jgi:hypothetical protein